MEIAMGMFLGACDEWEFEKDAFFTPMLNLLESLKLAIEKAQPENIVKEEKKIASIPPFYTRQSSSLLQDQFKRLTLELRIKRVDQILLAPNDLDHIWDVIVENSNISINDGKVARFE